LRLTTRPSRFKCNGPSVRFRIWHVDPLGVATGRATFPDVIVPSNAPVWSVNVPTKVPMSTSVPFLTPKLCGLNVPENTPVPPVESAKVPVIGIPATADARTGDRRPMLIPTKAIIVNSLNRDLIELSSESSTSTGKYAGEIGPFESGTSLRVGQKWWAL
jgi:hypothetical protein